MKILSYIPARLGSVRIPAKNLRLLNGRPLISYAIEAVQQCRTLTKTVINTESCEIASVAAEYGMESYMRPAALATSSTATDEIVFDFLSKHPCDAVAVINPTAPFIKAHTIDLAIDKFERERPSSLFSVNTIRRHAYCRGNWVNFDASGKSPRTQDLEPLSLINFIIAVFDANHALESYNETGSFLYNGDVSFIETPEAESFDIDDIQEFRLAESILQPKPVSTVGEYHSVLVPGKDYRS
ncbi:cytidylyltransferase domain-containing protein [Pararhizobium sp. DWP3-4]|uniref:acylneuraminate cytidylyltransferase family protein n=1 Tax=Pararhizobium sp. DWP3-4 TaxID=2804565 RepID=UPI003CF5A649